MKLGVPVSKITEALGAILGGTYINDFNRFGRQYKVFLQGEAVDRIKPENLNLIYVKNNNGDMLPLSTVVTATKVTGPEFTNRLNLFRSAEIGGGPAKGYSFIQAQDALEEVAKEKSKILDGSAPAIEMAKIGNEFGSVTGRARRCGWLDLVALKYAVLINGVTELYMMKGDVLSGFETLNICTQYKINNQEINDLPYSINDENIEPIYQTFKGWKQDITNVKTFENLPIELKEYITFIEEFVKVSIKIISVGPDRTQTIFK
jgi:hypothetical protein